jgi:hypothetical protein
MSHKELAEAVGELRYKCFCSKPTEIAKIEKTLRGLGLNLLAGVAREEGLNNCGSEYEAYYEQS